METWKDIPGYENRYQASTEGRIRSLAHNKERVLKPGKDGAGYLFVGLSNCKDSKKLFKYYKVHRLVALVHLSNPSQLPEINHLDGNKENNSLTNLQWCTHQENCAHRAEIGHGTKGRKFPDRKINPKDSLGRFTSR